MFRMLFRADQLQNDTEQFQVIQKFIFLMVKNFSTLLLGEV
jgi:hypothetical protein